MPSHSMMISDPNLIYYACIARGTTILAEFNSKDADLGALALKCLEKTPPLHSIFSHTVRNSTHTFLIEGPFTYFTIYDETLEKSEGLAFLKSVKGAFDEVGKGSSGKKCLDNLSSHCFQGDFTPVFHQLLTSNAVMEGFSFPGLGIKLTHESSSGSSTRRSSNAPVRMPLLGGAVNCLKKKKRVFLGDCVGGSGERCQDGSEKALDASEDGVLGLSREFSVVMHKNGSYSSELGHHQRAKKVWKKHVWVVLSMDLIICTILFVIWLWICRGFKCIDS